ncbi:MAG: phosphonopyruvate decarboxylase [Balneolaceae bacterium]|nr:phosphonopyruvate decarboxylase [Balneolaceae bacterium]
MIRPRFFYELLQSKGITYAVGVPDSLLKHYCAYAYDRGQQTIAANEGGAVALAAGYHLATGNIPMVYMQNSGFGNIVNPLTSLLDTEVYSIPMLFLVGWRGEPGTSDAHQHHKQGRVMEPLLEALEVPYAHLSTREEEVDAQLEEALEFMRTDSTPYVLLVSRGTFSPYTLTDIRQTDSLPLTREKALELLLPFLGDKDVIVSTTGKTSRELFELRERNNEGHHRDFLTVGSMGHASQIALGIALQKPDRTVVCIDGDGAALMHLGSLAIIGQEAPQNYRHILINNGAHDSVGGQPTAGFEVDFGKIARGCGYRNCFRADNKERLQEQMTKLLSAEGPALLEIVIRCGARSDLGRPTISPVENKERVMTFLQKQESPDHE